MTENGGRPPAEHDAAGPAESRLERRLWIAGYVILLLVVGAGALRRLATLF